MAEQRLIEIAVTGSREISAGKKIGEDYSVDFGTETKTRFGAKRKIYARSSGDYLKCGKVGYIV